MKLLTLARDLRRRKARERQGLFVAEGIRTVEELLHSPLRVRALLAAPALEGSERGAALLDRVAGRGIAVERVTESELASAADTESPQGVLAIGEIPEHPLQAVAAPAARSAANAPPDRARIIVLDALQDPGNAGTILRTGAAFGASGVVALPGTVDLWNAKVVRSAMGALFRIPTVHATADSLGAFLAGERIPLWAADAGGEPLAGAHPVPPRLAVALGNEGAGLSPALHALADRLVAIPIAPDVESLNVAVAAGILLYALSA